VEEEVLLVRRLFATAAVIAIGAIGIPMATAAPASAAGKICPTFRASGLKYQWETAGTGFTCKSAKHWLVKLIKDHADTSSGEVKLTNGPKGYHCFATLDHKHKASGGLCYKGTVAYPKSGFTWNGT
jgi:hypothetical protein